MGPARERAMSSLVALALLVLLGSVSTPAFWREGWFYLALGTTASYAFVEPYFTRPQDVVANCIGAIAAGVAAASSGLASVWVTYVVGAALLLVAALVAILAPDAWRLKPMAFRLATKAGQARALGGIGLSLHVVALAADGTARIQFLAIGVLLSVSILLIDWPKVWRAVVAQPTETATALAAIGPQTILLAVASQPLELGCRLAIEGERSTAGWVLARFPHRKGARYAVVLETEVLNVFGNFPAAARVRQTEPTVELLGTVDEGTGDMTVAFQPIRPLTLGEPIALANPEQPRLLYQVTAQQLGARIWEGGRILVAHATARLVGELGNGFIRGGPYLPKPHSQIIRVRRWQQGLPLGYEGIGRAVGTDVEIGLRMDVEAPSHIALLGMSGMGKTAIAHRLSQAVAHQAVVIVVDTTGEYRGRLGLSLWDGDVNRLGYFVAEPTGDPPLRTAELVLECLNAGAAEYRRDQGHSLPRVILLEEAHGLVPEWNFALRNQQDQVARTTRMIMQARKYNMTFLMVSQRTAVVSKSALSQCENYIILRTIDQTSLEYLQAIVGEELRQAIPRLKRYEAVCVGPNFNADEPVIVSISPPETATD